jgi:hypothetical protein
MEAGDVTHSGFVAWELSPDDAVARITQSWDELSGLPDLGEVCWLSNTEAGDERAHSVPKDSG